MTHDAHAERSLDMAHELHGRHGSRQFAHHAEPDLRVGRGGLQHTQVRHAQHLGQPPAHPLRRAVEIGVTGIERNAAADGPLDAALHLIGRIEPLEGMENDRMVRDDQIAPLALGFGHHLVGDVHGQQRLAHLVVGPAHDQPGVVVRLLPRQRRKTLDDVGYFPDKHNLYR